jgi:hypothetical protein
MNTMKSLHHLNMLITLFQKCIEIRQLTKHMTASLHSIKIRRIKHASLVFDILRIPQKSEILWYADVITKIDNFQKSEIYLPIIIQIRLQYLQIWAQEIFGFY